MGGGGARIPPHTADITNGGNGGSGAGNTK